MSIATVRSVKIGRIIASTSLHHSESLMELDTHADTTVLGRNCLIIQDFDRSVSVSGWNAAVGTTECRTISGVVAYDHPYTGQTYMLIFHQAIYLGTMDNHLICPMQCRVHGVTINDTPKLFVKNPDNHSHAIIVGDMEDPDEPLVIPLKLAGVTSVFSVRAPTQKEYEESEYRIEMTGESPEWEPQDLDLAEQEDSLTDFRGLTQKSSNDIVARGRRLINSVSCSHLSVDPSNDEILADVLERKVNVCRVKTSRGWRAIDADALAEKWMVSPAIARQTLARTTRRGIRTTTNSTLSRRFATNDRQMRYKRFRHNMYTDTMKASTPSRKRDLYAQVFCTDFRWVRAHPMKLKSEASDALDLLFHRDGVPEKMIMDGSKEQTLGKFKKKCQEANVHIKETEPYSPWQNLAESAIRELKKASGRKMVRAGAPKPLWADCIEYEAYIQSNTAWDIYKLGGETPETVMSGETADISQFCDYSFYEWIMFRDEGKLVAYPDQNPVLGRFLGVAIDVGPAMTAKILKSNGEVIHRSTYRGLTDEEVTRPAHIALREEFDEMIEEKWGKDCTPEDFPDVAMEDTPHYNKFDDVNVNLRHQDKEWLARWRKFTGMSEGEGSPDGMDDEDPWVISGIDAETPTPEDGDNYLGASILLPRGSSSARGKVRNRKRNSEGILVGHADPNPIKDTRTYEVEFPDGEIAELTANAIAESMYASCDDDGNEYLLFDSIVDHKKSNKALTKETQHMSHNGKKAMRRSTVGWHLCVQWLDGSTSWQTLKDLKESYPLEVAEYAVIQGIDNEPAFNWWVNFVLRKRERIIKLVKGRQAKYLKKCFKFGIEVPMTVKQAHELDKKNGNTLWADAIKKEMANVRLAFRITDDGEVIPPGYQRIRCHMIFDIKQEDFRRKARLVAGGHTTTAPATITYASVVSRESVRIALLLAALNDVEVKTADIENAYITAPNSEKIYTVLGPEFGSDEGKTAIVVRALYGLKSAGASFRNHLADCMRHLGFTPCLADPDLWMLATEKEDGTQYMAYVLLYVDDVMVVHHDALSVMARLDKYFKMKPGSIGDPSMYLGATLKKMQLENGAWAWANSPAKYVWSSVQNVEKYLKDLGDSRWKLPSKCSNPFEIDYEPELDETKVLNADLASWYASLIGMLRWMVEIGRVDIITEVSLMSSHMAMPREGHLDAVLHIFGFLKIKYNSRMCFDPTVPYCDDSAFKDCDWKQFYGNVVEPIPSNAPEPRGKSVHLRMYVDSDHAGEKRTRRSRTGFFVYINSALTQWISKKQATIETSVFGAEFVAMKIGMESLRGLRYKLRMMGVPIFGPSLIYGDNMSVIHNTQRPESTLKKKSNSIAYHAVRESVAMGESLTGHVGTNSNPADLATKVLHGKKRRDMVLKLLYNIYDDEEDE